MSDPNHETFVNTSQVKMLLASRMTIASTATDRLRTSDPFTVSDHLDVAKGLAENLRAIHEVERIWEALFGRIPSLAEVIQWSNRADTEENR